MPYISREDGEHFVIPSYREVLSAKNKATLKKQISLLSDSYGEYITMQAKGRVNYEIAFSPDTGYLLGETVWHHFNRPVDMIYCEAVAGTSEAILVVVKSGSVYLDGSFAMDSIADELVVFLTQENHFDIYVYGDVPISEAPEDGKFAFDEGSVQSFNVLDEALFEKLPLLKAYQLQLVEPVLRSHGIGVMPVKQIVMVLAFVGVGVMMWMMFKPAPPPPQDLPQVNPYQAFLDTLSSPAPDKEILAFTKKYSEFYTMPGWNLGKVTYSRGNLSASVTTDGSKIAALQKWADSNDVSLSITQQGIFLSTNISVEKRSKPKNIYQLKDVLATAVDRISSVYPGNRIKLSQFSARNVYRDTEITISLDNATPMLIALIARQLQGLPMVLERIELNAANGTFNGTINLQVLGK